MRNIKYCEFKEVCGKSETAKEIMKHLGLSMPPCGVCVSYRNDKSGAQKYMEAEKAKIQKNFKILELKDEIVKLRTENEQLKGTIKKALIENAGLKKKIEMWKDEKVALDKIVLRKVDGAKL